MHLIPFPFLGDFHKALNALIIRVSSYFHHGLRRDPLLQGKRGKGLSACVGTDHLVFFKNGRLLGCPFVPDDLNRFIDPRKLPELFDVLVEFLIGNDG